MTGAISASPAATRLTLDASGRLLTWPASAREMFGHACAIGQPLTMLIAVEQRGDFAQAVATLTADERAAEDTVRAIELLAQRGDNSTFHVDCALWRSSAAGVPVVEALIRDVDERVRADEGLRRQVRDLRECSEGQVRELCRTQALFRDLTDVIDEVIWMADPAITRMLYVSPGYERVWGRTCQSLYDDPRSFLESIHPDDLERIMQNLVVQRSALPFDHEYRIVRPDGKVAWIWDRGAPIRNEDGTIDRYIGVAQDITMRKAAEAAVIRQETIDAIGQMSGGLAHDFNNVLGVIIGHLDLLALTVPAGTELRENVDMALDAALRGSRLARRLLALARREPLERRVLDLGEAVHAMLPLLQHAAGGQTEVVQRIDARPLVSVDPADLDAALINMAVNARAAMPDGGTLTIRVGEIDVSGPTPDYSLPRGRYAELSVSDTGCGMEPSVVRRLGEPFFTTRSHAEGTGLGLAMIHAFVRQSSGAIQARSAPGAGTTFTILLPLAQGTRATADAAARGTMRT